ncbi:MAG: DUF2752 domain-containing protein [Bradymonadaceae bacterium]|nr:DUF2752 domain-containing protein [Lujinxingiaceae bacterium]
MHEALTSSERRKGWWYVGLFVGLLAASWLFPHTPLDGIIWCPFRRLTGFECMGCGMTRACVALVHGRLIESLTYHAFGLLLVLGLGVGAAQGLAQNVLDRRLDWSGRRLWQRHQNVVWYALLALLVVYWLVRMLV